MLEQKRRELTDLRTKKVEGLITRSRSRWINEGEKNTKYFCNLERRHFVQKAMCVLQTDSGDILQETSTIVQEVKSFYEKLYRSREHEVVNVSLSELNVESVLSDEESTLLEGPISMQETLSALKQMKNDKSPGSDGYTAEFF